MDPKELITCIARALVDHPEEVSVREIDGESIVIIELTASKSDMGKLIGKHGRTAEALRTILSGVSGKTRKRYMLELID